MMRRHHTIGNGDHHQPILSSRAAGGKSYSPQQSSRKLDLILLLFSCCISFYAGIWMAWAISPRDCSYSEDPSFLRRGASLGKSSSSADCSEVCLNALIGGQGELARKLDGKLDVILEEKIDKALETKCPTNNNGSTGGNGKRFAQSLSHFANGMVTINRKEIFDKYDFGVPMNPDADNQDVIMLYNSKHALPSDEKIANSAMMGGDIPHVADAASATANCDQMNVMFVQPPLQRQCMAIVGGQVGFIGCSCLLTILILHF